MWRISRVFATGRSRFDLGKSRQYPRTVARTWRHGCDLDRQVNAPGLASGTNEAYVPRLLPDGHELFHVREGGRRTH
jgi:hypothetical protein